MAKGVAKNFSWAVGVYYNNEIWHAQASNWHKYSRIGVAHALRSEIESYWKYV